MKNLCLLAPVIIFIFSCNPSASVDTSVGASGGCLKTNASEGFRTLVPVAIDEKSNFHIASQIYEGLVRFDKDLKVIPAIARAWAISADKKKYQFFLRKDVSFHDDSCFKNGKGRFVNVEDIRFCFEKLCSNSSDNRQYPLTFKDRVVGAESFFNKTSQHLEGIEIINDSTLAISLLRPDPNFLHVLCMTGCYIYPKEAVAYYGQGMMQHAVGTGPFAIGFASEKKLLLVKNRKYWGKDEEGRQLPYLDSICWSAITDRTQELKLFKNTHIDFVYGVPPSMLQQVFADTGKGRDFEIFSAPSLNTHYYGFNFSEEGPLQSTLVRAALNMAIDREWIVKNILKEEGQVANHGIVPFNYEFASAGYQYGKLKGFSHSPDSARKLLKQAGYGNGKKFPSLTLEVNDGNFGRNVMVALAVQKMIKENLGLAVNINVLPWPAHVENVEHGNSSFFRYAWLADYPDPESFLALFYSKNIPLKKKDRSYVNVARFRNERFDSLYEAARVAVHPQNRMELLSRAEQIVMNEAAVMPLYYEENFRVVRKKFRNLEENALNYIDFRTVYSVE